MVRAPLPAIAEGAVVELEIHSGESQPQLASGAVGRIAPSYGVPVRKFRVAIDAHRDVPLEVALRDIPPAAMQRVKKGKLTQVRVESGPLSPRAAYVIDAPPDRASGTSVSFSTGASWQGLAKEYSEIVEPKIAAAEIGDFLDGIATDGPPVAILGVPSLL